MCCELPIGIFDSGVGGLTVYKQVRKLLPNESVVYFGDTGRAPYGVRPQTQIREFVEEILDFMNNFNIKLGLVACNTITVLGLESFAKRNFGLIGISLGVESALKASKNKRIGVIGTNVTIHSAKHKNAIVALDEQAQVYAQACPRLAGLIETGDFDSREIKTALNEYLEPLKKAQIDTLLLACTHYPIVYSTISEIMGENVTIIDPAEETARIVYEALVKSQKLSTNNRGWSKMYFSGDIEKAQNIAGCLFDTAECIFARVDLASK